MRVHLLAQIAIYSLMFFYFDSLKREISTDLDNLFLGSFICSCILGSYLSYLIAEKYQCLREHQLEFLHNPFVVFLVIGIFGGDSFGFVGELVAHSFLCALVFGSISGVAVYHGSRRAT